MTYVDEIRAALPEDAVVSEPEQLRTYECDGLTGHRVVPALVALPATTEEVQAVVRACHAARVPFVARGAGTGLSGGALPVADGVVISLARMNCILEVDLDGERVVVQPGVTNLQVTEAVMGGGLFYAPDPSSQQVCTIGGNVAENSGGAHCLKYGFTVNHVTGLVAVLPDGEVVRLGGKSRESPGPDLPGAFVDSTDAAGGAVSGIVAARILPSAMEMMDRLTIEAAEAAVHPGYPDASAILLVELDGCAPQVEQDLAAVEAICRGQGAWELRTAADDHERALLWKGRKSAFAAMGRVANDYYVQDGVVPRTKLPDVLRRIAELETEFGLRVGNVFHAGDGNLHPLVLYDSRRRSSRSASTRAAR